MGAVQFAFSLKDEKVGCIDEGKGPAVYDCLLSCLYGIVTEAEVFASPCKSLSFMHAELHIGPVVPVL